MAGRFANETQKVEFLQSSSVNKRDLEDEITENRLTIEQFKAIWRNKNAGYTSTIVGVNQNIEGKNGWYYNGCKACYRRFDPIDGIYKCPHCEAMATKIAHPLYKLHLSVSDKTEEISCVVLNKEAEKLIGSSTVKLWNKSKDTDSILPLEVNQLCGKKIVFKLVLTDYNFKYATENFTVDKVEALDWVGKDLKLGKESWTTTRVATNSNLGMECVAKETSPMTGLPRASSYALKKVKKEISLTTIVHTEISPSYNGKSSKGNIFNECSNQKQYINAN